MCRSLLAKAFCPSAPHFPSGRGASSLRSRALEWGGGGSKWVTSHPGPRHLLRRARALAPSWGLPRRVRAECLPGGGGSRGPGRSEASLVCWWFEFWLLLRRHQQDSDLSVACSDADLHRHKKKKKKKKRHSRKSEDFVKDSELHLPKAVSHETVDRFRRTDGAFPLTDGLPLEGAGPFREKRKHLRMGSRDDRGPLSECGQGKRRHLELRL